MERHERVLVAAAELLAYGRSSAYRPYSNEETLPSGRLEMSAGVVGPDGKKEEIKFGASVVTHASKDRVADAVLLESILRVAQRFQITDTDGKKVSLAAYAAKHTEEQHVQCKPPQSLSGRQVLGLQIAHAVLTYLSRRSLGLARLSRYSTTITLN